MHASDPHKMLISKIVSLKIQLMTDGQTKVIPTKICSKYINEANCMQADTRIIIDSYYIVLSYAWLCTCIY